MTCPDGSILLERRLAELYAELRTLAQRCMRRERLDHTLQPTALVHEVYIRLAADRRYGDVEPDVIIGKAAHVMRDILVEHARGKKALKRGGDRLRNPLDGVCLAFEARSIDLLALDDALARLVKVDPEAARIVELRFFGGLTEEDAAEVMKVSPRTVRRGWRVARLWLARELGGRELGVFEPPGHDADHDAGTLATGQTHPGGGARAAG